MIDDCDRLHQRARMLHREARLGLEQALDEGTASPIFRERVVIANRCEAMADAVEEQIAEEC